MRCDVTRAQDLQAAMDAAVDTFGGLDVAFNNAGIEQPSTPAADITEDDWDRVIAVNLRGVFLSMKHEIPLLLRRGGGAIVNTSSGAGVKGFAGGAAYGAAKFGDHRRDQVRRPRLRRAGIRINAICPGIIDTHMIERVFGDTPEGRQAVLDQDPIGRMGQPDEIAAAVCGCARSRHPSPSDTPWSLTADKQPDREPTVGADP